MTKIWPILIILITTFLVAFAQFFLKLGANILPAVSINLFIGLVLYGIGAILFIVALCFEEVSVLVPIFALNFV